MIKRRWGVLRIWPVALTAAMGCVSIAACSGSDDVSLSPPVDQPDGGDAKIDGQGGLGGSGGKDSGTAGKDGGSGGQDAGKGGGSGTGGAGKGGAAGTGGGGGTAGGDAAAGSGGDADTDASPLCGNSTVDAGEECDDGNDIDTDACLSTCKSAFCGDTKVWTGHEECDDGNTVDTDDCLNDCKQAACGDGKIWTGHEQCDDGANNSDTLANACRTNCEPAHCGDGVQDTGEACDDGNTIDNDACKNNCSLPTCGDGTMQTGEACDDGNTSNTDDCLNTCVVASCGDSFVWAGHEDCDMDAPKSCTTTCNSTGTQACLGSCQWGPCTPPVETCDGVDNDCDGTADNGFACVAGATVPCTTTCATQGTGACTSQCAVPTGSACNPPVEVCNGTDDDCDGTPDDGFACAAGATTTCTTTCNSTGSGSCSANCTVPAAGQCTPPAEVCNGLDDDCNGAADNGFACVQGQSVSCTTSCGTTGSGPCTNTCELPSGSACSPPTESCNGKDDDCDGAIDDGFACAQGATVPCTTTCNSTGTGVCTANCTVPNPASCTPPGEACNGVDDDCDGSIDEDQACVPGTTVSCLTSCSSTGTGICTQQCSLPTGNACTPPAETCNGKDDDCVSGCDNGFSCCLGSQVACTTTCGSTGLGACTALCGIPTGNACVPPAEICNGKDDDCVSGCDNGFPCCAGAPVACTTTCASTGTGTCTSGCAIPTGSSCTPPAETCNGKDDDCNGAPDNGFQCVLGATQPCQIGVCSGTQTCVGPGCTWGACNFGVAPTNDSCTSPIQIPEISGGGTFTGSTCPATNNYTASCGGSAASADVVYKLTLAARSYVLIDTVGSNFDAVLHLHRANACDGSSLTEVACDDNTAGGSPPQARIANTFDAGTYWLVVDGAGAGSRGSFALNVFTAPAPGNDTCAAAIDISAGGTFTGDTSFAGDDNLPANCIPAPANGGGDVWYTFTLKEQSVVYLDTQDGGSWNTLLQIRAGNCSGATTACNNDACASVRSQYAGVLAAGTYYVAVDGAAADQRGPFTLTAQFAPTAACGAPVPSAMANGANWINTTAAGDEMNPSCPMPMDGPDVVRYIAACGPRKVTFSSCNGNTAFNSVLAIKVGSCAAPDLMCANDVACMMAGRESMTVDIPKGLSFFYVDGVGNQQGQARIDVSGL
ncbi:MAG: hypothetical protein HY898_31650 [Deltaproteobacteria bacterium]|nr:hypothetical protein [Deltaproteobacteria bacterium]